MALFKGREAASNKVNRYGDKMFLKGSGDMYLDLTQVSLKYNSKSFCIQTFQNAPGSPPCDSTKQTLASS